MIVCQLSRAMSRNLEMGNYILTGAGFSKNWGGWLSNELWAYLFGHPDIQKSADLRELLWENRQQGFENALEKARQNALTNQKWMTRYKTLESVVMEAFEKMDNLFKGIYNEFGQTVYIISKFIAKFDAAFTTNQDLLVEERQLRLRDATFFRYVGKGHILGLRKPGVKFSPSLAGGTPTWTPDEDQIGKFKLDSNVMPYIKLHGCMNGRSSSGHLMIMGGQKDEQIAKEPLIKWYFEIFKSKLSEPGSKLLVLGHSFLDPHINKVIFEAVESGNLMFYIWNTSGLDKIFKNLEDINQGHYRDLFKKGLISINVKPLKELFLQESLLMNELNILQEKAFLTNGEIYHKVYDER